MIVESIVVIVNTRFSCYDNKYQEPINQYASPEKL